MTSNVYLYRMGAGFPGAVNREQISLLEPNIIDVSNPPLNYGDAVKMGANGKIQALQSTDSLASIYGLLARPFPTQQNSYGYNGIGGVAQGYGNAAPVPGSPCSVLKRGYMLVALQGATAATANGSVYVRLGGTVPNGGHVGGIEAAGDVTGSTATAAAKTSPANTGNGSVAMATPPVTAGAQEGVYQIVYTSATAFNVLDPTGRVVGSGVNGTPFSNGIAFTATAGGTPFVAGDAFNVTVNVSGSSALTGQTYFRGVADSGGITEIAYRI